MVTWKDSWSPIPKTSGKRMRIQALVFGQGALFLDIWRHQMGFFEHQLQSVSVC
jgi:hypothetical protein